MKLVGVKELTFAQEEVLKNFWGDDFFERLPADLEALWEEPWADPERPYEDIVEEIYDYLVKSGDINFVLVAGDAPLCHLLVSFFHLHQPDTICLFPVQDSIIEYSESY